MKPSAFTKKYEQAIRDWNDKVKKTADETVKNP